ncbi:hypothetical protein [Maridesulfovibrio sp.]|uniref:serine O-acetyltransferase n=1 Tax=Maridesulfovibrio sp. TaxID=2795000 RepID=UPI002A18DF6B|nr:hypothetical protein [Maridesulfovibrio sp.]
MSRLVLFFYRVAFWLYRKKVPVLPQLINKLFIRIIFSCQIGLGAQIGKGVDLGYGGLGIVIHHDAVIGDNVSVGSCVTIGGRSGMAEVPVIGSGTLIGSGARVLGPVTVGKNCRIGANAVVLQDVPDNHLAVGVPAKIRPI